MAIKKKKKNYNEILYELQKEAVRNNTKVSDDDLVKVAKQETGNQLINAYKPGVTTTSNRTNFTRTGIAPVATTKASTTKKKVGLFDAFDDGYDFGDVTKTILTGGKMRWDSATVIGKGIVEDPIQTVKSIGVGIGEGFNKADEVTNNAVDDFFNWIVPGREEKRKNDLSVDYLKLEKFAKTATDEEKAKVLQEYEDKLGKDDPLYQSAEKILAGENKKGALSKKYYDTDTYVKAEKGELSETQQEIYEQGQSAGGMGYDLLWSYMTFGMGKGLGATAKTAKKVSEIAGKTSLFVRSQQSTYEEAVANGYTEKEARMLGVTVGGFEVGLESIGFDEFKGLDSIAKGSLIKKAIGEATEEAIMPYVENGYKAIFLDEEMNWEETTEEALKSAGAGATLGLVMGSGGKGYSKVDTVINKINNGEKVSDAEMAEAIKELEANEPGAMQEAINKATAVIKSELQVQETTDEDIAPTTEEVPQTEQVEQKVEEVDEETQSKRRYYQYTPSETDSEITRTLKESATKAMNDSTRSHEFVETVAKFAEKTGTKYRFTNDAELRQLGHIVEKAELTEQEQKQLTELKQQLTEAKTQQEYDEIQNKIDNITYYKTNGLVNDNGEVLINIDSQKALNSIVGHETFHLVENEGEADKLRKFAKKYAETRGDYQERLDRANRLYANTNANIENEVTADIIGDYLFTDQQFINNLSTEQPNLFQRIYNEIKHWIKMATAGSKEARQLEQLQHSFEKALNSRQASETTVDGDTKFSLIGDEADKTFSQKVNNTRAKVMKKLGQTDKAIWKKTGYQYNDATGKWQTEVSDAKFKPKTKVEPGREYRLEEVLDAEELFKAYPELRDRTITRTNFIEMADTEEELNLAKKLKGATTEDGNILIGDFIESKRVAEEIVAHEVQHLIQTIEGLDYDHKAYFLQDENGKLYKSKEYVEEVAEKEARQVQNRHKMSKEERRNVVPKETSSKVDFKRYSLDDNEITTYSRDAYDGQVDMTKEIKDNNGNVIAKLDYSLYEDTVNVQMIEVDPNHRRKGLGMKLLQDLQKQYPDTEIDFGMSTPDGTKLLEKATYTVENKEVADKLARIEELQKKLDEYDKGYEYYFDNDIDVPRDYAEDYNDLYDEMRRLQEETRGKKATKTFVKTDNTKYSLEERVSGDELLDAQDLIDDIKSVGGEVDANGYVTVYHQTTTENANKILETGKMTAKEFGVFFSTSKNAQQSDGRGTTKLEFKIPAEKLLIDDMFDDNIDVQIPLKRPGEYIDVSDYLVNNKNNTKYSLTDTQDNYGYHYGDLGKGRDTNYFSMSNSRRSTGHFGTGTYFVGNEESNVGSRKDNRPAHKVNFSEYNLFKPKNSSEAQQLHWLLKDINNQELDAFELEDAEKLFNKSYEELYEAYKRTNEKVEEYKNLSTEEQLEADSLSTVFMKELGYNGIDVRGIENFDNGSYGSVIYDLENKTTDNTKPTSNEDIRYSLSDESDRQYYYRGQEADGDEIAFNSTNFQGDSEGGVYFTTNEETARKYGKNVIKLEKTPENTVSVAESDKLMKWASAIVNKDIQRGIETDYVIEQMALGRPRAFAEYTKKPFVETGDMFGEENEVIYYEEVANGTSKYGMFDDEYSLSNPNEEIAPIGNYNVYGKDVKADNIAEEEIAPALQDVAENASSESLRNLNEEYIDDTEGTFAFNDEVLPKIKGKQNIINKIRSDFNIKTTEARDLYNKIANAEYETVDDVLLELEAYRDVKYKETNDYYADIKKDIRGARLDVSNIKDQITDYGRSYRTALMGKGIILGNQGQAIDDFYQELSEAYPNVFPASITAEADQLEAIADFMYKDTTYTVTDTIPDEALYDLAQELYAEIGNNERYRGNLAHDYFQKQAIKNGELVAPVETQEDYLKTLPKTLDDSYAPYLDMAKKLNGENSIENSDIADELNRLSANAQETTNEAENGEKEGSKVTKKKGTALDTLKYLVTNRNVAIDNYAKEVGNNNIKYLADHVNNVYGEVSTNINNVQTDNYGKAIGKSITDIFNQARKEGLSEAFNDYLFHRSNVARHGQGKGSKITLLESDLLIKEYNKDYPQFKKWANEVNQYNRNNLNKQVEAGLYTPEFAKNLTEKYSFYVPFFEDIEKNYVENKSREIGTRGTVKRAKGGADRNLLDFEQAMMKQTQSAITSIRKNQLYKEIVNSSKEKVTIGIGNRDASQLFADDKGYYLVASDGGVQTATKISEDLYKGLQNNLEQQIKDIEAKLGGFTKTLQGLSNFRRKFLTTWSPTFIVTNPLKDLQDAPLNSKYATSWAKNYPKAMKELTTGKGEHVQEFLNMYGQANLMGDYTTDSGVSDITKSAKIGKKVSKIAQANEILEMIPRYAEYLASLEHGTSQMEALYNAREVTTNFGRGGVITKALNRNGFTFLNASVQGFDKLIRNFSGENGAKGVVKATLKATMLGIAPALLNALMYDDDEEYQALPDYIKDNYYLIRTDEGEFIRIPKGRMLSIFGSAGRRTLELMQGEKDAFEGFLQNAYSQVGIQNPSESNILAPLLQAFGSENGETWYGTDIVPSRLQDVPEAEQYDETTDKLSIWLGEKTGISPYKLNYVMDQYSGGIGDILLPLITEEGTSDAETLPEMLLAPIKDKFTANSTTDNKYVSDVYTLSDELYKKSNSAYATDEDKLVNQYIYSITSDMGELYAERRAVQNDDSLTKAEKYEKSQAIKDEINRLAKEGLDGYKNVNKTENYAIVGGREFNKYIANDGTERWGSVYEDVLEEMNSLGMELEEKSEFFTAQSAIKGTQSSYDGSTDYNAKKRDIISIIKDTNLNGEQKAYLYDKYYASTETLNAVTTLGIDFDAYLDFECQEFEADVDRNGKTISGSKKKKVFDYINSMDIDFEQKLVLAKLQYNSYDEYNHELINYLNQSDLSFEEEVELLKKMGFEVDSQGNITW